MDESCSSADPIPTFRRIKSSRGRARGRSFKEVFDESSIFHAHGVIHTRAFAGSAATRSTDQDLDATENAMGRPGYSRAVAGHRKHSHATPGEFRNARDADR